MEPLAQIARIYNANCYELLCTFVKLFDIYNIVNMNRCLNNNKLNVNLFKCKQ